MKISDNRHYLLDHEGKPFLYLADTAWRLLYNTTREEAEIYLQTRKAQGFSVIMTVVISEVNPGENDENRYEQMALQDWDPARPNEAFFQYVDWIVQRANELGLVVALLPAWGEYVNLRWGKGPQCFQKDNAWQFGFFLGQRYRHIPNLIWVLGGDRSPETEEHKEIWRSMALGLRNGDQARHLCTFHPTPDFEHDRYSASCWFAGEEWLDFYLLQTGTKIDRANYLDIYRDYTLPPHQLKPTLDGECRYEHSHEYFNQFPQLYPPFGRRITAHQVRKAAYNALLSGAAGHTYGCRCVWNFYREGTVKTRDTDLDWHQALLLPGAAQMRHLRTLFEAYPFYQLVPDFAGRFIAYGQGKDGSYIPAAISEKKDFALAYFPEPMPVKIDLSWACQPVKLLWFDPQSGHFQEALPGHFHDPVFLCPPEETGGPDWVLIAACTD